MSDGSPKAAQPELRTGRPPLYLLLYAAAVLVAVSEWVGLEIRPDEAGFFLWFSLGVIVTLTIKGWRVQKLAREVRAADTVLLQDARAPVLYLREFAREGEPFMKYDMPLLFGVIPTFRRDLSGFETAEDYLTEAIEGALGPFVALGSPEDYMQPLGAARAYASDQEWKRSFEDLVQRACAVLLNPGSSRELIWELTHVRNSGHASKLFVVVGSMSFAGPWFERIQWRMKGRMPQPTWSDFRAALQCAGYRLPSEVGSASALICFDAHGQGTALYCDGEPNSYVLAIQGRLNPPQLAAEKVA